MRLSTILSAAVAALVLTAPLHAARTPHHRWSSLTLPERRVVVVRDAQRHRFAVRYWLRNRERYVLSSAPLTFCRALGVAAPGSVCVHGQRLVHDVALLRRIAAKLAARADAVRVASHYAGWDCIHNGAYPGAPHEGDSATGTYTGPLQMTYPWAGYYVHWHDVSIGAVYAIADRVAAARGYSYAWMSGQWPQTFPPCARYFE